MNGKILIFLFFTICLNIYTMEKIVIAAQDSARGSKVQIEEAALMKKALERIGYEMELVFLPGERAIRDADSGVVDGNLERNKEMVSKYKNLIIVEEPINIVKRYAYTINKEYKDITWEKLKDYKVASVLGMKVIEDELKGKMKKGEFIQLKDYFAAFNMLENNRVDYVIMLESTEDLYIKNIKDIKKTDEPLSMSKAYFVLNKKYADIAEKLAVEMREIKKIK